MMATNVFVLHLAGDGEVATGDRSPDRTIDDMRDQNLFGILERIHPIRIDNTVGGNQFGQRGFDLLGEIAFDAFGGLHRFADANDEAKDSLFPAVELIQNTLGDGCSEVGHANYSTRNRADMLGRSGKSTAIDIPQPRRNEETKETQRELLSVGYRDLKKF